MWSDPLRLAFYRPPPPPNTRTIFNNSNTNIIIPFCTIRVNYNNNVSFAVTFTVDVKQQRYGVSTRPSSRSRALSSKPAARRYSGAVSSNRRVVFLRVGVVIIIIFVRPRHPYECVNRPADYNSPVP